MAGQKKGIDQPWVKDEAVGWQQADIVSGDGTVNGWCAVYRNPGNNAFMTARILESDANGSADPGLRAWATAKPKAA